MTQTVTPAGRFPDQQAIVAFIHEYNSTKAKGALDSRFISSAVPNGTQKVAEYFANKSFERIALKDNVRTALMKGNKDAEQLAGLKVYLAQCIAQCEQARQTTPEKDISQLKERLKSIQAKCENSSFEQAVQLYHQIMLELFNKLATPAAK